MTKDIYSPLEIDEAWDQRAPQASVEDGVAVATDDPMMARTDPHAQDLHSDMAGGAQTAAADQAAPAQAVPVQATDTTGPLPGDLTPAMPAEPDPVPAPATPAPEPAAPADPIPAEVPAAPATPVVDDTAAHEAATIDENMAHMGQTVFEPQYRPEGADVVPPHTDDDAVAKMADTNTASPAPIPAEPAPEPAVPAEAPEPSQPTNDDEIVEDVDKNVGDMIGKLTDESGRLDQQIAEKNEQILKLQQEIDGHNSHKAAVQKRIDGLKAVIG